MSFVYNQQIKFDPTRPCGSRVKSSNKYTRKELEQVALSYKIDKKEIRNSTIDQLCQKLKGLTIKPRLPKSISSSAKFIPQTKSTEKHKKESGKLSTNSRENSV